MPLQAKEFYAEHKERPFFGGLVGFMTSGEAVLMILQKDNAIKDWRAFMGPTNSIKVPNQNIPIYSLRACVRGMPAASTDGLCIYAVVRGNGKTSCWRLMTAHSLRAKDWRYQCAWTIRRISANIDLEQDGPGAWLRCRILWSFAVPRAVEAAARLNPLPCFLQARSEAPSSLRAKFGTDGSKNACHGR